MFVSFILVSNLSMTSEKDNFKVDLVLIIDALECDKVICMSLQYMHGNFNWFKGIISDILITILI